MRKLILAIFITLFGIGFSSCSSDKINIDYNAQKSNEYTLRGHQWASKNAIGNIASNQTWGCWDFVTIDTSAVTKSANPNSNQWADFSIVPSNLTEEQKDKIMDFFWARGCGK